MTEIHKKQGTALKLLEEFKAWNFPTMESDGPNSAARIILFGLTKDILTGTEAELDRLIVDLEKQNNISLMKKLDTNIMS
jgi:hypothetical protein|tara:strand:- start:96 stop:335 length:240 start_codon:yes stop_codon:yes gene_type:complete